MTNIESLGDDRTEQEKRHAKEISNQATTILQLQDEVKVLKGFLTQAEFILTHTKELQRNIIVTEFLTRLDKLSTQPSTTIAEHDD